MPFELPFELPPPEEELPPPEEPPLEEPELLVLPPDELLDEELELLDEELELLEVEDPPPEEEAAGSPSWANASCRCTTMVPTTGPKVETATTATSPMAAAINAYSTAAAPAESPIIMLLGPPRAPGYIKVRENA